MIIIEINNWNIANSSWCWQSHNDYDGEIEERAITEQIFAELEGWA
jgi:hypothetical protein